MFPFYDDIERVLEGNVDKNIYRNNPSYDEFVEEGKVDNNKKDR